MHVCSFRGQSFFAKGKDTRPATTLWSIIAGLVFMDFYYEILASQDRRAQNRLNFV